MTASQRTTALVYDPNPEAAARRVAVIEDLGLGVDAISVPSRIALRLLARRTPAPCAAFVNPCAANRLSVDRPGERLIRRLAVDPDVAHVQVIAWASQATLDVVAGARAAGAHAFVAATPGGDEERRALRSALSGQPTWPDDRTDRQRFDDWSRLFASEFGVPWQEWMEPVLVRLAAGGDRRAVAEELVQARAARSGAHAVSRLREVAKLVAREHANHPARVAARATELLDRLSSFRQLAERPARPASLEYAASIIETSPARLAAAGLTDYEASEIAEFNRLIQEKRARDARAPGAPPADRVRMERRWAAGQRALAHGAERDGVDAMIAGLLNQVEEALQELEDCRHDELAHPAALAAVALALVDDGGLGPQSIAAGPRALVDGLTIDDLACTHVLTPSEAHAVVSAVDEVVHVRGSLVRGAA